MRRHRVSAAAAYGGTGSDKSGLNQDLPFLPRFFSTFPRLPAAALGILDVFYDGVSQTCPRLGMRQGEVMEEGRWGESRKSHRG